MKLSEIIVKKALVPELRATSRDEAIKELVKRLAETRAIDKNAEAEIAKAIIERENNATTGIGKGVALPHVSLKNIKKLVATIGLSSKGIDFKSLDNQPVHAVVLLVSCKEKPDEHLHAMETIFSAIQEERFRKFLFQAKSTEALVDLVAETST